jgi:LETM1 and EF-hand domain-containing protein 1
LQAALAKLKTKVEYLEQRAQLNEIMFHHEDYKEVGYNHYALDG